MRSAKCFRWASLFLIPELLLVFALSGALRPAPVQAAASTPTATPGSATAPPSGTPGATGADSGTALGRGGVPPKVEPTVGTKGVSHPLPKRLREAGVSPASVTQVSNIVLSQPGAIRVTKDSSDTSCYAGTFGLSSPGPQNIWTNYGDYPEGNPPYVSPIPVGSHADIGSFAGGQALVFFINPYTPGAVCANQTELSTDPNSAQVYQTGTDSWEIYWEDHHKNPDIDFNDLVVHVERLTPPVAVVPGSGPYFGTPLNYQTTSNDPVNTFTGSYTYTRTDLAIAGRGPSPTFARAYNGADPRTGPLGPGWTDSDNVYLVDPGDGSGDLVLVGPQGRSDRYHHNPDGSFTPPAAVYTTLVKNADLSYTATMPDQTTWGFDPYGRLQTEHDRYGNVSTFTYDLNRQLVAVSDPAGRGSLTLGYGTTGLLASVSDWTNRKVQFGYDANGRLQTVTDRNSQVTAYGYDGTTSHLTTITDANGHVAVTMTYDGQGRVATQKDAMGLNTGQQTTFSYPASEPGTTTVIYPATSFDGIQPTVADVYDGQGRLTRRISHPSASETYTVSRTYDANSNVSISTDGRGNVSTLCWDVDYSGTVIAGSHGNLTRAISPPPTAGATPLVTLFKYDGKHNLLETVAPKGVGNGRSVGCSTNLSGSVNALYATDNTYDANGVELLSTAGRFTDPDLGQQTATTKYEYGDSANPGRVTRTIPPRGNTGGSPDYSYATTMAYYGAGSQAGMLQTINDPLSDHATYGYDAVGRKLSMVDPVGNTWRWAYDNEDRVTSTTAPAPVGGGSPLVTQARYDAVGNLTVAIDANGQVTKNLYDVRDALSEVDQSPNPWTDPNVTPNPKYVTTYQHDNLGNLSRTTRAAGDATNERATDDTYDGLNRLRQEIQYPNWPSTSGPLTTQYAYDANGNQTGLTKPDGTVLTFTFDAVNRPLGRDNPQVAYTYDADGNRLTMGDPTGTTSYSYDELDRLLSVVSPGSGGSNTVGYRYDLDGNRRTTIYPDSTSVTATFDKADRLTQLADWASRKTTYGYFADGLLQTVTNVDGSTASYSYDNARRLTQVLNQVNGGTISQHSYTLERRRAVGRRHDEPAPDAQPGDHPLRDDGGGGRRLAQSGAEG